MLLKNTFTDRSKTYAIHDIELYSDSSKELYSSIELLDEMNAILKSKGIDFLVIILPYEYQLREKKQKYLAPQNMLLSRLSNKQVRSLDAYKYFTSRNVDSKKFYLYADAMHLSPYGHKVVFEFMQEELLK